MSLDDAASELARFQASQMQGAVGNARSAPPDRLTEAANSIRARIKKLDQYKATYLGYLHDRIDDADWHACWDVCVNLSEISCSRDEAVRALEAMGMEV